VLLQGAISPRLTATGSFGVREYGMIRVAITVVFVLGLASCAPRLTHQAFDQQLSQIYGQDINHVISKLGPPAKIYGMPNGDKLYTFVLERTVYRTPTTTTANVWGGYGGAQGTTTTTGGNLVASYCRIDFTVNAQQRIIAHRSEGNRCIAPEHN
jgi:hypothetical protein